MKETPSPNFLRDVAQFFAQERSGIPHADIMYVLPNKRAGLFLKREIHTAMTSVGRMPRLMTLRRLLSRLAETTEAPARSRLFMLYDAYRTVMRRRNPEQQLLSFDNFIFWGDMVLNDFDEIDKSGVSAEAIFRNLKQLKQIQSDYLNDEQKEAIRRIWGESSLTQSRDTFWLHVNDDEDSVSRRFVFIWEILAEVYTEYKAILAANNVASRGDIYLRALKAVENMGFDQVPEHTHYVFVGFNDATAVETLIFRRLKDLKIASFVWDTAPLELFGPAMGAPLQRLAKLAKAFRAPDGFETRGLSAADIKVDVYAVPSNFSQTKEASAVLTQWVQDEATDGTDAINSAVVLPDQALLLPMLMSVPAEYEKMNVSMSMNYRSTSFATLLQAITTMQMRVRKVRGELCFYYDDVAAVLNQPHVRYIDHEAAVQLLDKIKKDRIYNVPASWICSEAECFKAIFKPVRASDSVGAVKDYLLGLIDCLRMHLQPTQSTQADIEGQRTVDTFETRMLDYLQTEVSALATLADKFSVEMGDRTFMRMFEKMLNYPGVPLSGTPLAGLQLLGVLETRDLDFDNVAVLSMNESIFPRRQYSKTMIPYNLRAGFGLPDAESLENTYAYCFFRLVSRAKRVALFYDCRNGQTAPGEMSRYITRLLYMAPEISITTHSISISSNIDKPPVVKIEKDKGVQALLSRLMPPGNRYLSASALKTYKSCQVRFFLQYVGNLREDDEMVDWLNAADHGDLVHSTIQRAIAEFGDRPIGARELLDLAKEDNTHITLIARDVVLERFNTDSELNLEGRLAVKAVASQARNDLRAQAHEYCADGHTFRFHSSEFPVKEAWKIDDNLTVNWRMFIDMIETTDSGALRLIDFKTGKDSASLGAIDDILSDRKTEGAPFQLLTYCQAYLDIVDSEAQLEPRLHILRSMALSPKIPLITVSGEGKSKVQVDKYSDIQKEFRPVLYAFIKDIFDTSKPFVQTEKEDHCRFCPFIDACGKNIKEDSY